jgi:hypothetical protein
MNLPMFNLPFCKIGLASSYLQQLVQVPLFPSGMSLDVDLTQPGLTEVGVNLRGRNVGMSQKLLHRAEVCPVFQKMGGKRMPQRMRADFFLDSSLFCVAFQDLPKTLPGQPVASGIHKKSVCRSF